MKKFFAMTLAVLILALSLTACGSKDAAPSVEQTSSTLVIATSPDFPPFEALENGEVVGIEVDLLSLICEDMGLTPEIQQMDFESVLPGVQSGKYDVGMSGISVTPSREKNVLFTVPYCLAAQAIVVTEGSPITDKADLEGKTVSVQTATTAEIYCMENGYTVNSYAANSDAQLALTTGKVDAWVIDDLTAADMVKVYNAEHDDQLVILPEAMTTEPYAFALAKGNTELAEAMNASLEKLIADGTVAALFEKYEAPYTAPNAG